jgi:hypothetical protein
VAQERFIDERVSYKEYEDYCSREIQSNHLKAIQRTIQHTNTINATLLNGMLDNTVDMAESINHFCEQQPKVDINVSKKATTTVGIYTNTSGLGIKDLCHQMNVKTSAFWKATTRHGITTTISKRRFQELLKRTVYSCNLIPRGKEWQIYKIANKFYEAINNTATSQNIKPNRLVISLMIIACELEKVSPTIRIDLCKEYRLSIDTLHKHEGMLQHVLSVK